MVLPFSILFGLLGYLVYRSKDEVTLIEKETIVSTNEQIRENDNIYNDLDDLFI